ncbi:MAG: Flp pilus assembly protein TadD [Halioglobus sp.]|jgi:Flp pilus assembly protein TadD
MNNDTNNPDTQHAWQTSMDAGKQGFAQGRMEDAVQSFSEATQLVPHRVEGWINLGSALLECTEVDASVTVLAKAVRMNPKLMVSHMLLGDAQRLQGKRTKALQSYREAVALRKTPQSLNRLACLLRGKREVEEAQNLYMESIALDPNFTLAHVNLATLQIERHRYEEASSQLRELGKVKLPTQELREVTSAHVSLSEFHRLTDALTNMNSAAGLDALEAVLQETPANILQADKPAMVTVNQYRESAVSLTDDALLPLENLPEEWPMIEGMFMIPLVHSVAEYRAMKADLEGGMPVTGDIQESIQMEAAIVAARSCRERMSDPVRGEVNIRHWHKIACDNLPDFLPGHFKYTQNWSTKGPTLTRVNPALTSGTVRHVVENVYSGLDSALARGIIGFLAVSDLHPFADGNGRVAITWLNRELEWAGLMPALFSKELGLKGELGKAVTEVRTNGGDLAPIIAAISHGQKYAREFCAELAKS